MILFGVHDKKVIIFEGFGTVRAGEILESKFGNNHGIVLRAMEKNFLDKYTQSLKELNIKYELITNTCNCICVKISDLCSIEDKCIISRHTIEDVIEDIQSRANESGWQYAGMKRFNIEDKSNLLFFTLRADLHKEDLFEIEEHYLPRCESLQDIQDLVDKYR